MKTFLQKAGGIILIVGMAACLGSNVRSTEQDTQRTVAIRMKAPDLGWKVRIDRLYLVNEEIWAVAALYRTPGPAGQAITTVSDTITVTCPTDVSTLPVRYFVLGKTWQWENREPYTFLSDLEEISADLATGKLLFERDDR